MSPDHFLPVPPPAPRPPRRRPPKPAAASASWTRRLRQTLWPPGGKGGGRGGGGGDGPASAQRTRNGRGSEEGCGHHHLATRPPGGLLLLFVLLCHYVMCLASAAECPDQCDCKWKGGKETVECQRASFYMVPSGIDSGTQVLDFNGNNLQVLPKDTFVDVGLVHLQRIYLRKCSISQIDREAFRSLSNLVELDLSNNLLAYVPTGAFREGGPQLRRLYLSGNPLQRLGEEAFAHIPSLETIELSDCQLESIDATAFVGLPRLARLKLDSNRLPVLRAETMLPLRSLNELYLDNNPWRCDCHLRALREWMSTNRVSPSVPPTCSAPSRLRGRSWSDLVPDDHVCEPQITLSETSVDVQEGDNVTVTCHIVANPEPAAWWMWKGRQLLLTDTNASMSVEERRGAFAVSEDGTLSKTLNLTITLAGRDVSGTYACVAENHASIRSANLTLTVGREANESRLGFAASHITGIVIGIAAVIVLLIVVLCVFTLKCKASTPKVDQKRMDANHKMMRSSANHVDALAMLEEQDTHLLGPNPIQKPPRLGQYHGVPTIDLDHFEKDLYVPNNVASTWKSQVVVVELTKEGDEDDPGGGEKCVKRDEEDHGGFFVPRGPSEADLEKGGGAKDTSLLPIVEEECRESEEGDDSGLELDRGRETELRSDAESDRERLQEKNKRNQEKRSPISLRDANALEREFFGVPGLTREKLRQGRQALQRGGSGGGGGGDSTCSSSDPPTVPSSPQRQTHNPPTDSKVLSLMVPVLLTNPRPTGRPTSFEDDGEEGTEV